MQRELLGLHDISPVSRSFGFNVGGEWTAAVKAVDGNRQGGARSICDRAVIAAVDRPCAAAPEERLGRLLNVDEYRIENRYCRAFSRV